MGGGQDQVAWDPPRSHQSQLTMIYCVWQWLKEVLDKHHLISSSQAPWGYYPPCLKGETVFRGTRWLSQVAKLESESRLSDNKYFLWEPGTFLGSEDSSEQGEQVSCPSGAHIVIENRAIKQLKVINIFLKKLMFTVREKRHNINRNISLWSFQMTVWINKMSQIPYIFGS